MASQVAALVAAIDLKPLVLLEDEIAAAVEAFAVKYFDILHRRRVLHGSDPFDSLTISDEALRRRVSQVLLNLTLRLRQSLLLHNDASRTHALVDAVGPLRATAVALQETLPPASDTCQGSLAGACLDTWRNGPHRAHAGAARERRSGDGGFDAAPE